MCFFICFLLVLLPLLFETRCLNRARKAVPIRIHIHGTRGKTSAVKMTAALLRNAGLKTLAKTTGDMPELIYPDGHAEPIVRKGPARIAEQIKILLLAAKLNVEALVIEGMALQAENLSYSERILQATHMAIVNVREDHAESMGWTRKSVAQTLAETLPKKGHVYFSREAAPELESLIKEKALPYTIVEGEATQESADIACAIAKSVLQTTKIKMPSCASRELTTSFSLNGLKILAFDFLSANDTTSSELLLQKVLASHPTQNAYQVLIFASRSDRPLRTVSFMRWLSQKTLFDAIVFAGSHRGFARLSFWVQQKANKKTVLPKTFLSTDPAHIMCELVLEASRSKCSTLHLYCMGNTHGAGEKWRTYLSAQRSADYAY